MPLNKQYFLSSVIKHLNFVNMKAALILSLVFVLGTTLATAQHHSDKGRLEIAFGASTPVGSFGEATVGMFNHITGSAKTGESLLIGYHFPSQKKIGFSLNLVGTRNPINTKELEHAFASQPFYQLSFSSGPPPPPPGSLQARYYKNWNFDKTSWLTASFLAAADLNLPINNWKNFFFTAKAGVGVMLAVSPDLDGSAYTDTSAVLIHQSSNGAFGFCFTALSGLAYQYNPHTRFHFNVGYQGTPKTTFTDLHTIFAITSGSPSSPIQESGSSFLDVKQSIQLINATVGVSFIL